VQRLLNQVPINNIISYETYLSEGMYGAWLLFFVSARTNKRHHHRIVLALIKNKSEEYMGYGRKEGTYHKRLFRGPSTNDMKKQDGPSRSWPTPHTTPFFLPPEDPSLVLRPNSIPE
jgi:hypothetical protein